MANCVGVNKLMHKEVERKKVKMKACFVKIEPIKLREWSKLRKLEVNIIKIQIETQERTNLKRARKKNPKYYSKNFVNW